jgi:hypothetical protein
MRIAVMIRKRMIYAWGGILILCWILPGYLLARNDYALGYDYIQNIRVAASAQESYLLPLNPSGFNYSPEHQGSEILKLLLIKMTGIPIEDLLTLPIGGLLVPLAFFLLCREFFDSKLAAILSLSVAFDPTVILSSYHTTIYSWSRPILLMIILLYYRMLKNKSAPLILLTVVLFICLFFLYWTDPSLIVFFTFIVNVLMLMLWLRHEEQRESLPRTQTISLALAFLVINLGLGEFIYGILPRILGQDAGGQFGSAIFSLYQRLLITIGVLQPIEEVFATYGDTSPILRIQVIRYALMFIPVVILGALEIRRLWKKQVVRIAHDPQQLVLWSIVGMLLFHTLLYSSYGHASTRYIALFGPFMGLLALLPWNSERRIHWLYAISVSSLAVISFFIEYPQTVQKTNWTVVRPAVAWYVSESENKRMISNVGTFGMFAVEGANIGTIPIFTCFTDPLYDELTEGRTGEKGAADPRYDIVIDKNENNHEMCPGFTFYSPLHLFSQQIKEDVYYDSVYDNGSIWILQPNAWLGNIGQP